MKKVFFLLFVALCLVSCRTAAVEDTTELEIVVPIVEESAGTVATSVEETFDALETTEVPVEPEGLESSIVTDVPEVADEDVASEDVSSDEVSSEELPDALPQEPALEPALDGQSDLSENPVVPVEETLEETPEETSSIETDEGVAETSVEEEMPSPPAIETTEQTVGEARKDETAPVDTDVPAVVVAPPSTNEAPAVDEGSFLDRLIAFILREKLFCFGVFTVIVGLVMLIVVLIRDLVRTGSGCSASAGYEEDANEVQEPDNEVPATATTKGDKKESLPLDDEDEFLRSLLNS